MIALLLTLLTVPSTQAGELDALMLSEHTRRYHMPYGQVAMTLTETPNSSDEILFYMDVGDTALWTGTYLAAESFRYSVRRDEDSLSAVRNAIAGIRLLVDAPGSGYLARSTWPVDGVDVENYVKVEGRYGLGRKTLNGTEYYWQAGVTRDQYGGVFFGLGAAYDYVDDEGVRQEVRDLVTRMTDYLIANGWTTHVPESTRDIASTTFFHRPEMRLSILQLARHVNPERFQKKYDSERFWNGWLSGVPPRTETWKIEASYFKFNLDFLFAWNLVRLERDANTKKSYLDKYRGWQQMVAHHQNPHFNMIDRALRGPDDARDAETRRLLDDRLAIGFRNRGMDVRGKYPSCGENLACDPVPLLERAIDGFIWQRSPFGMYYEGDARIE
ncbi:MAG TPA: hypothetical protein VM598_04105, partial [Bdellovibrionota bacterium]|nr:hypothetical protein [Bdellovibrionota bacterium]